MRPPFCTERYTLLHSCYLFFFVFFFVFKSEADLSYTGPTSPESPRRHLWWFRSKSSICLHLSEGGVRRRRRKERNKIWRRVVHALGSSFLINHVFVSITVFLGIVKGGREGLVDSGECGSHRQGLFVRFFSAIRWRSRCCLWMYRLLLSLLVYKQGR